MVYEFILGKQKTLLFKQVSDRIFLHYSIILQLLLKKKTILNKYYFKGICWFSYFSYKLSKFFQEIKF